MEREPNAEESIADISHGDVVDSMDSAKNVQDLVAAESPGVPAEKLRILMPTSKSRPRHPERIEEQGINLERDLALRPQWAQKETNRSPSSC